MSSVDERIVRMQFDNAQFEAATRVTMQTLEKLKSALKLDKAGQAFDNVTKAAEQVDLAALQNGVNTVADRFSTLGIIGMTALQNITNAAVNAGAQMIKSLTIDPINQGFGEYELKMGSVQTIMASTGADLDTVNGYLEQLNTYADKTIYSFSDMTNSIGKFTNAGVDLDTAVKAIQGISNEAALSGANANEASRAMYNFSQALSAGAVKLIDWKSIENANMATKEFKQELIDTAVKVGTLTKAEGGYISTTTDANGHVSELFNSTKNFNDSLSAQWMTTEVLTKTLSRYANENSKLGRRAFAAAQDVKTFSQMMDTLKEAVGSGWSQTFELIFGDFNEAKELWTGVANAIGGVIDRTSSARNELLKTWKAIGGRDAMIRGFANIWTGLLSVLKPIKEAFGDIFGSIQPRALKNLSRGFAVFTKQLIVTGKTAQNIKDTFKVLFAILKVPVTILKTLTKLIAPILSLLMKVGGVLFSITGFISRLILGVTEGISKFIDFIDIGGKIQGVAKIIGAAFDGVRTALGKAFDAFKNISFVKNAIESLKGLAGRIQALFKVLAINVSSAFSKAFADAGGIASKVAEKLSGWFGDIIDKAKNMNSLKKVFDTIGKTSTGLYGKFTKLRLMFLNMGDNFEPLLTRISTKFTALWRQFKELPIVKSAVTGIQNAFASLVNLALDKFAATLEWITNLNFEQIVADAETFFTTLYQSEEVQTFLTAMGEVIEDLSNKFDEAKRAAGDFIEKFKVGASNNWQKLIDFLKDFAMATKDVHTASDLWKLITDSWKKFVDSIKNLEPLKKLADAIKRLKSSIGGAKDKTGGGIKKFFENLGEALKNADWLKIARTLRNSALAIRLLIGSLNAFKLNNQIVGLIKQIKKAFAGYQRDINATALIKMAGAFAIFVGAIIAIAYNAEAISKAKWVIVGIAALIVILVGAIMLIQKKLGGGEAESASEALGTVIKKLTGTLKLVGKAVAFAAAAAGVYLLAKALKTIVEALNAIGDFDASKLTSNLGGLTTVVVALIGLVLLTRLAGKYAAGLGVGVLALAVGIKILIQDVKDIAEMNLTQEQAEKVAGVITTVGLVLAAAAALASVLGDGSNFKGMLGFAAMFVGLGLGIRLIIDSMNVISKMSDETIKKALAIFGELGLMAVAMMYVSKNAHGVKAGPIIALAVMIGAIAVSLWALSKIDTGKLLASTAAMGLVLVALGFVAMQLKELKPGPAILGAISLGLMLAAVVAAFVALDYFKVDGILEKAEGIALVLGSCAIVIALLGQMPITAGLTAAANLAEFIGVLAGALALMGDFAIYASGGSGDLTALDKGIEIVKKVGEAIGGFIGGIAAGAIDELASVGQGLKTFGASVGYFMTVMENHDGAAVSSSAQGLADALTALIGANFINNIASVFGGENGQLDDFGAKLKTFGEALVSYADTVSGLKTDAIDKSVEAAEKLTALTDQVHNGGWLGKWTGNQDLDTFGRNLVVFGNALVTFGDSISDLNTEKFSTVAEAVTPLVTLTNSIHNGGIIGKWTGNQDLDTFGKNLEKFGKSLGKYQKAIVHVDPSVVESSASVVTPFIDLTNQIHNSGFIDKWLNGDQDLDTFGSNLEKFGKSLAKYAESIGGDTPIDVEQIATSAKAASALADVAAALQNIPKGSTTLGNFSGGLASFGAGIKNYGNNISGLSESIVADSQRAHNAMVHIVDCAIAVKDASEGGIFKDTSLGEFSGFLEPFGAAMKAYSLSIAGIDEGVVQNTITASASLKTLSHAAEEIPNTSGLAGLFGETDIGTFAKGMQTFGGAFKRYSRSIAGMDENVVTNTRSASEALKTIANAANDIPNSGGLAGIFSGNNDVGVFGDQLKNFGSAMKAFTDELANVSYENIDKTVKAVKDLSGMASGVAGVDTYSLTGFAMSLKQMAADGLSGFSDSFATGAEKIRVQVKSFVTAIGNIIKNTNLSDSGKKLVDSIIKGFRDNVGQIRTVVPELIRTLNQAVISNAGAARSAGAALMRNVSSGAASSNDGSMYQIGRNLGEGLRLGIVSKSYEVYRAGYNLGKKGAEGAKRGAAENSPSKLTIQVGEYLGEGLVIGMNSYVDKVERSGYTLGSKAASAVDMMVASIMDAVETDAEPVITPVLDLSQIQTGTQSINGMLTAQTVSFNAANAQISALSSTLNHASLEAEQNQKIVDELGKLRDDITTMGNRMRNLQVVMDSGELVGSITDKVDRSLGMKYA